MQSRIGVTPEQRLLIANDILLAQEGRLTLALVVDAFTNCVIEIRCHSGIDETHEEIRKDGRDKSDSQQLIGSVGEELTRKDLK